MSEGFDHRTSIVDPSTGAIVKHQPYTMKVDRAKGTLYERPPGSGIHYYPNGQLVPKEPEPKAVEPPKAVEVKPAVEPTQPKVEAAPPEPEVASAPPKGQAKAKQASLGA